MLRYRCPCPSDPLIRFRNGITVQRTGAKSTKHQQIKRARQQFSHAQTIHSPEREVKVGQAILSPVFRLIQAKAILG